MSTLDGNIEALFMQKNILFASFIFAISARFDPFKNTLTVLKDPSNDRTLYLIGTTNSSTLLANRTRDLIAGEKPDAVFVQTNKEWWNIAKNIEGVKCQQELNRYSELLKSAYTWELDNTIRNIVFKTKFYSWLFVINWFKGNKEIRKKNRFYKHKRGYASRENFEVFVAVMLWSIKR